MVSGKRRPGRFSRSRPEQRPLPGAQRFGKAPGTTELLSEPKCSFIGVLCAPSPQLALPQTRGGTSALHILAGLAGRGAAWLPPALTKHWCPGFDRGGGGDSSHAGEGSSEGRGAGGLGRSRAGSAVRVQLCGFSGARCLPEGGRARRKRFVRSPFEDGVGFKV